MRNPLLLAAAALAATAPTVLTAQTTYVAALGGHQEVPSVATPAEGEISATLTAGGDQLRISGSISGLSSAIAFEIAGGAHVHIGYAGENGPVALPLAIDTVAGSNGAQAVFTDTVYDISDVSLDLDGDGEGESIHLAEEIRQGRAYVNVHTERWRGGEVRGQLHLGELPGGAWDAMLYGEQQNPAILSDGIGGVVIEITDDSLYVSGSVTVTSPLMEVAGTPAHLHFGLFGQNGPVGVLLNLVESADGLSAVIPRAGNAFPRTDGAVADVVGDIARRGVYVNVHTEAHPAGELRGQIVPHNSSVYMAHVSDVAPNPAPDTDAELRLLVEKSPGENQLVISGSYSGWFAGDIDGTAPFVRLAGAAAEPLAFALLDTRDADGAGGQVAATTVEGLTDAVVDNLFRQSRARAGFSTDGTQLDFASGLYHECKRAFHSQLTASQAVPTTDSRGGGAIITEYYTSRIAANGFIGRLTGPLVDVADAGGLHIHEGYAGTPGGIAVVVGYETGVGPDGDGIADVSAARDTVLTLTEAQAALMRDRGLYYNAHTEAYPGGEVRGQVTPRANSVFYAAAGAGQAVPGFGPSPANGALYVELTDTTATFTGSFRDLTGGYLPMAAAGSGAHLHGNVAGRTGGVLYALTATAEAGDNAGVFQPAANTAALSPGLVDSMLARQVYLNVHSETRPAGELRGQVGTLASNVLHAKLSPDVTVPYTGMMGMSEGQGHVHAEVYPGGRSVVSGSWDSLSTAVDASVAGGAHVHTATVAEAGGIAFGLSFTVDSVDASTAGDSTSVTIPALDNVTDNDPATITALLAGDAYVNVHTAGAPSGAVRGQLLASPNGYPSAPEAFSFPEDGAAVDLGELDSAAGVRIEWGPGEDPDAGQDVAHLWQLYVDTAAAPVAQTQVSADAVVVFTVGELDTLLMSLGVAEGGSATVFHRASATDGSLVTPGAFSEVTFERRGIDVGVAELPVGSVRLVGTLATRGGALALEVGDLPAGPLSYRVTALDGRVLARRHLEHGGSAQRYSLAGAPPEAGVYALTVSDAAGRRASWVFVVQ